jgi:predicted ribosome quality control (RQC) complex YloA/Tae2 family protein
MEAIYHELVNHLLEKKLIDIFKKDETFYLQFEKSCLLICLKKPFVRIHLTKRCGHDIFPAFTNLKEKWLKQIQILNGDKILEFDFGLPKMIVELIATKPNLYLVDKDKKVLYSFYPSAQTYQLPENKLKQRDESIITSQELEKFYTLKEKKEALLKKLKHEIKQTLKKIQKFKDLLQLYQRWEEIQKEAYLLQAYLYQIKPHDRRIKLLDWETSLEKEIELDPHLKPHEQVTSRLSKSKKFKKGIPHLHNLIEKETFSLETLQKNEQVIEKATTLDELTDFEEKKVKEKKILKSLPYREFYSETGLAIRVGKSAKDNEKLTFSLSKGQDFWLHVRDLPGSHVVIACGKNKPDEETLKDAMQLALHFSKAKGEGEIIVTQVKFLSRQGKRAIGEVFVSTHKVIYIKQDPDRLTHLKKRQSLNHTLS